MKVPRCCFITGPPFYCRQPHLTSAIGGSAVQIADTLVNVMAAKLANSPVCLQCKLFMWTAQSGCR